MKKLFTAALSICLLLTMLAPCCAAQSVGFQVGEFSFDGVEATRIGANAYSVTISEDSAWAVLYAVDVSDKESMDDIQAMVEVQQDFWDSLGADYTQTPETLSVSGFDIPLWIYTASESGGDSAYQIVGTFTDTWYVYTFLLTAQSGQYKDSFAQLITAAQHSGKEARLDSTEPTEAATQAATVGQLNALRSANSYLNVMPFSYSGLIKQLEYEGYTEEEAQYAADNCGADWMEQAVKSAEKHLNYMGFSRDGLIKQLEYEGFTHEQAVYGVEQNGL